MNIRPKTKRRVIVLAVGALVLVGAGVGVYARYVQQHNARVAEYRAAAMRSYTAGDYAAALPDFDKYLTLSKTAEREASGVDAEALFAYGKSRASVELPGGRQAPRKRKTPPKVIAGLSSASTRAQPSVRSKVNRV